MKYFSILLIFIPAIMANSCKCTKKTEKTKSATISQQIIKKVIIDKNFDFNNYKNDFAIKNTTIADSTLSITFAYTGCTDDELDIVFNGNYVKTFPPKASLNLIKKSSGKDCEKQVEKTLLFNISPIRYPSAKTLVILFPNYEQKLMYNY